MSLYQRSSKAEDQSPCAIVPDLQSGRQLVASGSRKRSRNDSGCYPSEYDLSSGEEDLFLDLQSFAPKRPCNPYTVQLSPQRSPLDLEHTSYNFNCDPNIAGITIPVTTVSGNSPDFPVEFATASPSQHQQQQFDPQMFNQMTQFGIQQHSMQQHNAAYAIKTVMSDYQVVITQQPEEYYRARYQTEGVRAPIKGRTDNFPAIKVYGPQFKYGTVTVKLVHEDGSDHTSCSLDCSEERKNALQKKIGPHNQMATEFEDLRIRREKKKEGRKATSADKAAAKDGHNDKVAYLLFVAQLQTEEGDIVRTVRSDAISLTAAPEPAELDWIAPSRGHFSGREEVVIKGSKMTSPKVTFRFQVEGRHHELHGTVDKDRSHQNVLLVRTPPLTQLHHYGNHPIQAKVMVTTGRSQLPSNVLHFEFIPDRICRECLQETPQYPTADSCDSPIQAGPYNIPHTHYSQPTTPNSQSPTHCQAVQMGMMMEGNQDVVISPCDAGSKAQMGTSKPLCHQGIVSPDAIPAPPPPSASQPTTKPSDDLMQIMQHLLGEEYQGTHTGVNTDFNKQTLDPQMVMGGDALYPPVENQLQPAGSPYHHDLSGKSPSTDTPLYSPVTPSAGSPQSAIWIHIEQILLNAHQTDRLSQGDYLSLQQRCYSHDPSLMQAYNHSNGNEESFFQMLASTKPLFQTTHL